jgi:hypothetical protein
MFWILKLSFDGDIFAFFGLATVLATFFKIWAKFPNLLVTLGITPSVISSSCRKCHPSLIMYRKLSRALPANNKLG